MVSLVSDLILRFSVSVRRYGLLYSIPMKGRVSKREARYIKSQFDTPYGGEGIPEANTWNAPPPRSSTVPLQTIEQAMPIPEEIEDPPVDRIQP